MLLVAFCMYVFVAFSKTFGKSSFFFLSFFSFLTLYQYLWSKLAKSCFNKHFYRSLESIQVESRRYFTPGAGSWLRTVNVSITCRVWHHDASNSSNGRPVISGSHATHWNNEKFLAEPRPQGFSLKNGRGGKRHFFKGKLKALGTSLDKAPQQPPLFSFSLIFPLSLILFCLFTTKKQWNKSING